MPYIKSVKPFSNNILTVYSSTHRGTWLSSSLSACQVITFLQSTAVSVSVLSMLAIAFSRYLAVRAPLRARTLISRRRVCFLIVIIWIASLATATPHLLVRKLIHSPELPSQHAMPSYCVQEWSSPELKTIYNVFFFLEVFVVPLLLMILLYWKISTTLLTDKFTEYGTSVHQRHATQILAQRRRTVRNIIILVNFFALSWLPYYVVTAWLEFNGSSPYASVVTAVVLPLTKFMAMSNASVNPTLYCFLSHGCRKTLKKTLCRKVEKKIPIWTPVLARWSRNSTESKVTTADCVLV